MTANHWLILSSLALLSLLAVFFFQPRLLLSLPNNLIPGVVYFVETEQQLIALTIDDGPDPQTTAKILEVLQRYQAHATFFIISDRIKGNEAILERMVNGGHELGNHLTEDKPSIRLSPEEFTTELLEAEHLLSQFAKPRWLRPASGWYNASMVDIAHKHNYKVALGSIFPFDTHLPSSWFASQHILSNAAPGEIVVLHDHTLRGERTVVTLERILPKLAEKGYGVVTLSELFENSSTSEGEGPLAPTEN